MRMGFRNVTIVALMGILTLQSLVLGLEKSNSKKPFKITIPDNDYYSVESTSDEGFPSLLRKQPNFDINNIGDLPVPTPIGIKINPRGTRGRIPVKKDETFDLLHEATSESIKRVKVFKQPQNIGRETIIKTDDTLINLEDPPPVANVTEMARYIVHNSDWTALATISSRNSTVGFPFVNVISTSDGPSNNSSGTPFFYMTPLDMSSIDLKKSNKASVTMSLAQGDYCKQQSFDPEDPRCARVILVGKVIQISNGTQLEEIAQSSMFERHPDMANWPKDHGWYFAYLDISHITVLDTFGGAKDVDVQDYYAIHL